MQVLGDDTLCGIARELVTTVRGNVTIDWTLRENVRANLRRLVKRILRKHGYPPDSRSPRLGPYWTRLRYCQLAGGGKTATLFPLASPHRRARGILAATVAPLALGQLGAWRARLPAPAAGPRPETGGSGLHPARRAGPTGCAIL